ncbi:hypothetical protein RHGRI_016553 [Rhododendron griersonianum]|uniref:Uncharacterized protein n=1 Tax=Rhododendron griersonianum TaxID=479676 RepID=A0AAV6JUH8_9ERIC|nr:hypothetical protein RHGRI_016553 [Rhododendron griersonianum]
MEMEVDKEEGAMDVVVSEPKSQQEITHHSSIFSLAVQSITCSRRKARASDYGRDIYSMSNSRAGLLCTDVVVWWWRFGLGWCGGGSDSGGSEGEERGEGGREWWWRFGWVLELELGEWRMEGFQIGAEGFGFRKQRALNGGALKSGRLAVMKRLDEDILEASSDANIKHFDSLCLVEHVGRSLFIYCNVTEILSKTELELLELNLTTVDMLSIECMLV